MRKLVRPLLVFDGECAFCRFWIERWRRTTGDEVDYEPSQSVAADFPEIAPGRFQRSVVLIEPDGRVTEGAHAVFRSRAAARPPRAWRVTPSLGLWLYEHVPPFAAVSELLYRSVAAHRGPLTIATRLLWGRHVAPPGERLTATLFLRALAVVYFAAFASLGVQIVGLVGRDGVLPIGAFLDAVAHQIGPSRFWLLPTLCWWNSGDSFLVAQCAAGCVAAVALLIGWLPVPMLALLWVLYLSVSAAGQDFLWFQWDSLLLETGFLAILLAPWTWRSSPERDPAPSRGVVWMLRWLLFRLMVSSAIVKITSGDPTWRDLSALHYHYETQPLPTPLAPYFHALPAWFQRVSAIVMFAVEGCVPFLIVTPRRLRIAAAVAITVLQTLIAATGNYGFFNLLTIVLCLLLLDDGVWPSWVPSGAGGRGTSRAPGSERRVPEGLRPSAAWPRWVVRPVLAIVLVTSVVPLLRSFRQPMPWLRPLDIVYRELSPLHLVNPYGLFAVMTTSRPEIIVEGSDDGAEWKPYAFRWKAGDLRRPPPFVAPHMPRLDWQMWFAALDEDHIPRWYAILCLRLLEGSRPVVGLLEKNPFGHRPPRFIRAVIDDYHFTDAATRRATGQWWRRDHERPYGPVLTLVNGELTPVRLGAGP